MLYSPSTGGFYLIEVHGDGVPEDAIDVPLDHYYSLLKGQSEGKVITAGPQGCPILVDPPAPAAVAPDFCTPSQGLIALFQIKGITDVQLEAAIESIGDLAEKYQARIAYSRAITWGRKSVAVQTLAELLGLTEKDLDDLFILAATINA